MSAASGANSESTPACSSFSLSDSNVRGYFVKSSLGPNCFGFTKIEAITGEHSRFARSISAKCPRCSAPIVGTSPTMRFSARACRACSFIHAIVRMISTGKDGPLKLRARCCGALAVEMHQVCRDGLRAELPQQRRDLAAMIGAVIRQMLHRFPERIAIDAELQRFIFEHAVEIRLRQAAHKTEQARFEFVPAFAQACHIRELCRVRKRGWRAPLKALQPNPFGAPNMCKRVAHGSKARAHWLHELLRRQRGSGFERAAIRPGVVVIEYAHFLRRHLPLHLQNQISVFIPSLPAAGRQAKARNPLAAFTSWFAFYQSPSLFTGASFCSIAICAA